MEKVESDVQLSGGGRCFPKDLYLSVSLYVFALYTCLVPVEAAEGVRVLGIAVNWWF